MRREYIQQTIGDMYRGCHLCLVTLSFSGECSVQEGREAPASLSPSPSPPSSLTRRRQAGGVRGQGGQAHLEVHGGARYPADGQGVPLLPGSQPRREEAGVHPEEALRFPLQGKVWCARVGLYVGVMVYYVALYVCKLSMVPFQRGEKGGGV